MNEEQIRHLAKLASLELTDEEVKRYTNDMQGIINFANEVNNINTENIEISARALDIYNVFRKDEIKESQNREELLQNCKTVQDGMFEIPNVIE